MAYNRQNAREKGRSKQIGSDALGAGRWLLSIIYVKSTIVLLTV
jgi:hypothetical protein